MTSRGARGRRRTGGCRSRATASRPRLRRASPAQSAAALSKSDFSTHTISACKSSLDMRVESCAPATALFQAGHIDGGKGTVQAIVVLKDDTAPTRVYQGSRPYEGAAYADMRANRTEQARAPCFQASNHPGPLPCARNCCFGAPVHACSRRILRPQQALARRASHCRLCVSPSHFLPSGSPPVCVTNSRRSASSRRRAPGTRPCGRRTTPARRC